MWDTIRSILGKGLPFLANSLGGPFAGKAVGDICGALGLSDPAKQTPDSILQAFQNASPDQIIALKAAEQKHEEFMAQLGYDQITKLAELNVSDRASARAREIAVKDNTPRNLAYGYGLAFVFTLAAFIWLAIAHVSIDPAVKSSIDILLGIEVGMVLGSKEYFFGSSSGSDKKTEMLAQAQPIDMSKVNS